MKIAARVPLRHKISSSRLAGRNALRCFAASFLVLIFCSIACAQISPGPLSKPHQGLSGETQCTKCHEFNARTPTYRCVQCHTEIASELDSNRGLHATYPHGGPPGTACIKCHSDHNGVNFNLLHWDPTPKGFDHAKTGFVLNGKHSAVTCRNCHLPKNIASAQRARLTNKDLSRTWMGLSPSCVTCHEDKHNGRFGQECKTCHNTTDWKNTTVSKETFDHSRTRYPLTGAHRSVDCAKCHTAGPDGKPRYAGIPFSTCSSCHADPHKGAFKQSCESCHSTATWKKPQSLSGFDHARTEFPLLGKHAEVSCIDCHKSSDFKKPIPYKLCSDCHADIHSGQFKQRADGGKCESCHTVQGWAPSTFTVQDHAKTKYPLVFPHEKVKCAQCHIPAGKETRFKIPFARCVDCHKDEHQGQFAESPWFNQCERCHNAATFKSSSFTLQKHQQSAFPLTGGHVAVACNDCHKTELGRKLVRYHFPQLSCTTCHEDVHKGQFEERMSAASNNKVHGCEVCHDTRDWHELSRFDHNATKFPLVGSHRAVACADCHKPPDLERTLVHVRFADAPKACSECHENPHADQFGPKQNDCAACHNTNKWKPTLFDHDTTNFPLKGGHENVSCGACHKVIKSVNGKDVLFYKPTPRACADCHGANVPQLKNPQK
jgi:hypothetical protein